MPTALITGITGQDGSYLAEYLLDLGYHVHGIIRRSSSFHTGRIDHIFDRLHLHYGDLCDGCSLRRILEEVNPDEVYNLAAQSHVRVSFDQPEYTGDVDALGTLRLLEAIRDVNREILFYQASSSELFGNSTRGPINEQTPFDPRSPYACAKAYAYYTVRNYREAYDIYAVNGILFNHESPRRGETFVTRKVTRAAARIATGLQSELLLGNLNARRDWGFAGDYVKAMHAMMQLEKPDDFVIGTGEEHSIYSLLEVAFGRVGLDWHKYVRADLRLCRPTDVFCLLADPSKAREVLKWKPRVGFRELIHMMVDSDLRIAQAEATAGVQIHV